MTRFRHPRMRFPPPPAGPHEVFFRPNGGRWRLYGRYPTRELAVQAMYAPEAGSGGWRMAPVPPVAETGLVPFLPAPREGAAR